MLRKLFLGYFLTLLLLLSQQSVFAHEISHLQDAGQSDQLPHGALCDKCLSLANLDTLFPGSPPALPLLAPQHSHFLAAAAPVSLHPAPSVYLSRAPPKVQ